MSEDRIQVPFTSVRKSFADPKPAWGKEGDDTYIRCGGCGQCINLDHTIAPNGDVNPSVHHDDPRCGWHVWVTLVGWKVN